VSLRHWLCCLAALSGCASTPAPPGTLVSEDRLARAPVPGHTTRAELLAAFGPTRLVTFDSGFEAWLYQVPAGAGRFSELVILIDPAGVVRKIRRRPPALP
jgi:hypothetical protein